MVALGGCGGAAPTAAVAGPTASPVFSRADVAFAAGMTAHHRQALELAELAGTRAGAEVRALAAATRGAREPQLHQLAGWLRAWGEPVPPAGPAAGHPGSGDLPGLVGPAEVRALARLRGAAFDRRFLTLMIAHDEGTAKTAGREKANGANPEARALAATIADTQSAEIARIQQLAARP
ncbi:DUF305 domain-containing protein [Pilimelia terevasa]|uniref:DUF305 domain-containing protein n=1 Tax=Pilimelia terevasa TaxID=53372 RepID=UPI001E3C8A5A|nr:DUF305 domain-containing protein [Pilimelia terevasa]